LCFSRDPGNVAEISVAPIFVTALPESSNLNWRQGMTPTVYANLKEVPLRNQYPLVQKGWN